MSDQQDDSQKTEEPTPKKLEEARKKGQVAISRELNNWIMLLAATILIMSAADPMFRSLSNIMQAYIEQAHDMPGIPGGLHIVVGAALKDVLKIMTLPLIVLMLAAFLGPFLQVGPLYAPETIQPDFSKISPMKGLERLFSKRSLMEFVKGLLKLALVSAVGIIILKPYFSTMDHMVGMPIPMVLDEMKTLTLKLMIGVLTVLMVIALIDVVYQRMEHMKKMRMSKQELKDEYRQSEGDPHVKSRLRQLRGERARQRMIQAVPGADVVITNPTHYSIALKYDSDEMEAPKCVAKGVDELALRIREVAKENNVILYENVPLARALYDTVEVDEIIPPEHYKGVAEVISYVYKIKGKFKPGS